MFNYHNNILYSVLLFSSVSTLVAQKNKQTSIKPNIVVFVADDAGLDFGCYGNENIYTPNIDNLAKNGLKFQNAFLTAPQSSPSRTSMLSGKFAHTIGTEDLHTGIDINTNFISKYLSDVGYTTAYMLKTHWGINGDKQFDVNIKGNYTSNQGPLQLSLFKNYEKFLDENKDTPFFLWIGFIDPHRPYNRDNTTQINDFNKIIVPPYLADSDKTKKDMADYYNEISRMDRDIGVMVEALKERNLLENTIVIFLSDNGMPFPRAKGTLYDSGIKTPLIFMWKNNIKENSVHSNGLISTIDLAPTILDLADVEIPLEMYGQGFKALLFNPDYHGSEFVFSERNWHDTDEYIRCVRSKRYKLIYNAYYHLPHGSPIDITTSDSWYELLKMKREGGLPVCKNQIFQCPRPMIELYDLEKDPFELNNVADLPEYLPVVREHALQLEKWQKKTKDHPHWKRRRGDQSDRITGAPLYSTRPAAWND